MFIVDSQIAREVFMHYTHKYKWTDLLYGSHLFFDLGLVSTFGKKWKG